MCKSGGSKLHKFVSNSKDVIRRIPESDKTDGVKKLDLDLDSRVAPLKPVIVPRLQLTAAVCSVRISQQLRRELTREVKVNYLESAECAIIHAVQTSAFKEELDVLKQIKRKNPDRNSRVFAQQRKTNIKTYS